MFRDMNKKILVCSIIVVAILIGVSFTSVVGYQSNSRTIADISPLFTVRSSRALDVDSKDLSYNYVGKGEETKISLPERYAATELVDNLINLIKRMDDKSLQRFTYLIMYYLHNNDYTQEFDHAEILQSLKQLKDNPDIVNQYIPEDSKILTNACTISPTCGGSPLECFVFMVKLIVFSIIYVIIFHIYLRINYLITIIFKSNKNNT